MIKVGLTGNYFSGQDEVAEIFSNQFSVPVFDADSFIRYLVYTSKPHMDKLMFAIGKDTYKAGLIDTSLIDTNLKFDKIIDILHIDMIKAYTKFRLVNRDSPYTIFKSSFLFERKLNCDMDYNINVYRPKTYRREDLYKLTKLSTIKISSIIENELDELYKNKKSDYKIDNYLVNSKMTPQISKIDGILKSKVINMDTVQILDQITNVL